jgi:hypothetical protein
MQLHQWISLPKIIFVSAPATLTSIFIRPITSARAKNITRNERFVKPALGDVEHRDQPLASIEEDNAQNLLVEKLHIGTSAINGFRIIQHARTSVLTLCDPRHGESNHYRLGLTLRQELTELLKRSAGQSLDGAEVADQGKRQVFFADK